MRDAGPWIAKANPEYLALIDQEHIVTKTYGLVNVPTGVWINEQGKIVRPPEVAYVDERYRNLTGIDPKPYLNAIRDWVANGDKSIYVMSEDKLRAKLTPASPDRLMADAEFTLAEYMYHQGHGQEAIAHFKESQRLAPDNWNYKRQAYLFSTNPDRDYGTDFAKEVQKLNGKPYYAPVDLPPAPAAANAQPAKQEP